MNYVYLKITSSERLGIEPEVESQIIFDSSGHLAKLKPLNHCLLINAQ